MIFGDLGDLKFPDICLTGEEKPRKNLIQETCPDRGSNPGPLRDRRSCYRRLAHSGGHFKKVNLQYRHIVCRTYHQLQHSRCSKWPPWVVKQEFNLEAWTCGPSRRAYVAPKPTHQELVHKKNPDKCLYDYFVPYLSKYFPHSFVTICIGPFFFNQSQITTIIPLYIRPTKPGTSNSN